VTEWEGWRLEIVDMDGKRIDKVLAARLVEGEGETASPPSPTESQV
jgi:putative hemolysin